MLHFDVTLYMHAYRPITRFPAQRGDETRLQCAPIFNLSSKYQHSGADRSYVVVIIIAGYRLLLALISVVQVQCLKSLSN